MIAQLWPRPRNSFPLAIPAVCLSLCFCLACASDTRADDDEPITIAPPKNMTLETEDGLEMRSTYYAGGVIRKGTSTKPEFEKIEGKKVVPIMMVHGWEGQRNEYSAIAHYLQQQGHAVITFDLRGHGESKRIQGMDDDIDPDKLNKNGLAAMVNYDMQAAKDYLMERNNAGELNIDSLCVIGAEFGAIIAMNWAVKDWSYRQFINRKYGRDVKALILLSPERAFKGLTLRHAMTNGLISGRGGPITLPLMIIVGEEDSSAYREAKTIYSGLERTRPKVDKDWTPEEIRDKQTLFLVKKDTSVQGTKLLDPRLRFRAPPHKSIEGFIHYKLVLQQDDFPWQDRDYD